MNAVNVHENIKLFDTLCRTYIKRQGIDNLIKYLGEHTDFYTAPASTKYHGSFRGGLLAHSLEVYYQFMALSSVYGYCVDAQQTESAAIVTLFHDVCKINTYKESTRNVKNAQGVWETVPCFIYNGEKDFGAHGAESVHILTQHLFLTREETIAIYHHMGAWYASKGDNVGKAYETHKLAWLLHVADEAATYIGKI